MTERTIAAYADIIGLAHHVSASRPHMSLADRAAQFAPFAALTGYGEAVSETERLTGREIALTDAEADVLNHRMARLAAHAGEHPRVTVTHFVPDTRKAGGEYRTEELVVHQVEPTLRLLIAEDGREVALDAVIALEGALFDGA